MWLESRASSGWAYLDAEVGFEHKGLRAARNHLGLELRGDGPLDTLAVGAVRCHDAVQRRATRQKALG